MKPGSSSASRWHPFAHLTYRIEKVLSRVRAGWPARVLPADAPAPWALPDVERSDAARLQALFDGALNGILLADDRGVYIDANPAICRMLGYERDELVGMTVQQLVVAEAQPDVLWQRFLDQRQQVGRVALRCKHGPALQVDYMATTNIQPGLHLSVLEDATQRSEDEANLHAARGRLLTLAAQHSERFEAFRAGLARDLHDELGQTLGALQLEADRLRELAPASAQRIQALVREGLDAVRDVSLALRPATLDLGLPAALRALAADTTRRSDLDVVTDVASDVPPLGAGLELTLFRVAQEALNNAVRHAGAAKVSLCLGRRDQELELEVCDDGLGFDPEAAARTGGLGLAGMRERADLVHGRLSLISAPGAGTLVRLCCPLPPQE